MNLIVSSPYRNNTLQIWQYPTGLFGYVGLDPDGNDVVRSAGNFIDVNIAATAGLAALDRVIDLPTQADLITQMIAQREQQMEG